MMGSRKAEVRLSWLDCEYLILVCEFPKPASVPAVTGMVNWLAHEILLGSTISLLIPQSLLTAFILIHNSHIAWEYEFTSFLCISECHNYRSTPSTESIEDPLFPTPIQIVISLLAAHWVVMYSLLTNLNRRSFDCVSLPLDVIKLKHLHTDLL